MDASDADALANEEDSISVCIGRLKSGDPDAVERLWEQYSHRLVALARKKLGDSPRRAMDENDVVQKAFSNFCQQAQAGGFPDVSTHESLWALLALMTARTAANQRIHEGRAKRGGGRVSDSFDSIEALGDGLLMQVISDQPSAEDALIFVAQLEHFMDSLDDPRERLIVLWKLEERTNEEIARCLDCSLSAVERKLRSIRRRLSRENSDG